MAKLKPDPIAEAELTEFLDTQSDFAFELHVLNRLTALGYRCDHGGTYEDPATKKLRQFDIRAMRQVGYGETHLAVECKQLRENFPLLILRVPRHARESYHDVLMRIDHRRYQIRAYGRGPGMPLLRGISVRHEPNSDLYPSREMVGKSCAQIGRETGGSLAGSDAEMFGKWSQAISSAEGVLARVLDQPPTDREGWLASLVLPIVVVPDDRLWVADYAADGSRRSNPVKVNRCSYWIGTTCLAGDERTGCSYELSHLEFVTVSGLEELVASLLLDEGPNVYVFDRRKLEMAFEENR